MMMRYHERAAPLVSSPQNGGAPAVGPRDPSLRTLIYLTREIVVPDARV